MELTKTDYVETFSKHGFFTFLLLDYLQAVKIEVFNEWSP